MIKQILELSEQAKDRSSKNCDLLVPVAHLTFTADGGPRFIFDWNGETHETLLSEIAFAQLSLSLGIPVRYADRCYQASTELLEYNFGFWMLRQKEDTRRMIRLRPSTTSDTFIARAYLSDRYCRIDNSDVLWQLAQAFKSRPDCGNDYSISHCTISDDDMNIQILRQKDEILPDGSIGRFGFSLTNSEVGGGAVHLTPWLSLSDSWEYGLPLRLKKWTRHHKGCKAFDDSLIHEAVTLPVPEKVSLSIEKGINRVLNESIITLAAEKIRRAMDTLVPIDVRDELLEKLLSQEEKQLLAATWKEAETNWDLVRQVAWIASQAAGHKKDNLEGIAWQILTGNLRINLNLEEKTDESSELGERLFA